MNLSLYKYSNIGYYTAFTRLFVEQAKKYPDKRIGIIDWWFIHTTDKLESDYINQQEANDLKEFLEAQDVCFLISEETLGKELYPNLGTIIDLLNQHNVHYLLFAGESIHGPGEIPLENTLSLPWFAKSVLHKPEGFKADIEYTVKQYTFNLLLGKKKYYRTMMYNLSKDNKNIYYSYLGHPKYKRDLKENLDSEQIQKELTSQDVYTNNLDTMIDIPDQGIISHIIPQDIYANTHFDIVSETQIIPFNKFTTEKTAKPLATGRFFLWYNSFSIKNYLEKFGFGFDGYLLHNYDDITDDLARMNALFELVSEISASKHLVKDIYTKTKQSRLWNMTNYNNLMGLTDERVLSWIEYSINKD